MEIYPFKSGDFERCRELVTPFVHRTPILRATQIDNLTGCKVYFKCENFQRAGSYKIRGAMHALLRLQESGPVPAVVTHSSGNFAQALSLAAKNAGIPAHIVMPNNAPEVKKKGVRVYGGEITESLPTLKDRESEAERLTQETKGVFIHPSNDPMVMLGQGTACAELLDEFPDLTHIITPVGGGGLLGGTALATYYSGFSCEVVGSEPMAADDAYRSLLSGKIEGNQSTSTIADGLRTVLGSFTFPVIYRHVKTIIRVEENEIVEAMRLIWERMKIIVEPSSAVALAAILREPSKFKGARVGLIISGGNVDLSNLPF
jgi:threonine dehydratase